MVCSKAQSVFVARLPELQRNARSSFRHLSYDRREEAVQNVLTLVWKHYRALVLKGRSDAADLLTSILYYAVRQTRCGRAIQGNTSKRDVLERRRRGEATFEEVDLDGFVSRRSSVLDAVSFRMDVPRFMDTLTERQRQMAFELAAGETTSEVAKKHGVTAGAVSQFRQRFKLLFEEFFAIA